MNKKYKLGVVGRPIEHSLSPFIHSRFSRNENIHIEYLPYKVDESDFEIFIKEFFSDKDSKGFSLNPALREAAIPKDLKILLWSYFLILAAAEAEANVPQVAVE